MALLFLALSACSGGATTPTGTPTPSSEPPLPTTAAPTFSPTPVPTPDPSLLAIRPCTAEDLGVQFSRSSGATGHAILFFGVQNVSASTCRVYGAPAIDLLDAAGPVLGSGTACGSILTSREACENAITILEPSPHDYAASFTITWLNPAFNGLSCEGETAQLAIELPDDGGRIDLGDMGMPSCARPGTSEFVLSPTPTPTPVPTVGYR
jgi:hypothetical protein